MSAFVTEPKSLPSTPAFCATCTVRPSSFAALSCASVSCCACTFSSSARRCSNSARFSRVARFALPCGIRKLRAKPSRTLTTSPSPPRFVTFSSNMICIEKLLVHVGVRQQREKARALDRDRQLTLVTGFRPGDPRRNDLSVLVDEILEDSDVLVIDLLD